ncbi:MAG: hypothetical protein E7378_00930 [Clostridiales bacterium]|nr:hypothetical protein [Clostridiales bacterium]
MKTNLFAIIFCILTCGMLVSCVVPFPSTNSLLLSPEQQQFINDKYEQEVTVGLSTQTVPVLNLDWFEYMDKYFTKYVKVRVIDIYSNREYYVKRMGGYNHADVQTIDTENTKIFKEIYGGTWSWKRRPVWVEIDGKFYAGSTNGMPHGFDILQTGEGGHTCIHFLNSKTHGTKRVDPDHQSCVKYAAEHTVDLNNYLKQKNM